MRAAFSGQAGCILRPGGLCCCVCEAACSADLLLAVCRQSFFKRHQPAWPLHELEEPVCWCSTPPTALSVSPFCRLQLVAALLPVVGMAGRAGEGFQLESLMDFANPALSHSSADVRGAAIALVVQVRQGLLLRVNL